MTEILLIAVVGLAGMWIGTQTRPAAPQFQVVQVDPQRSGAAGCFPIVLVAIGLLLFLVLTAN